MRITRTRLLGAALLALTAAAGPAAAAETGEMGAQAAIVGTDGAEIGTVSFFEGPTGVLIKVEFTAAPPGPHGMHLHAVGKCEPGEGFKSAGGHIEGGGTEHGLLTEAPHAGDLPSVYVDDDGQGHDEFFNTRVSLGEVEGRSRLLDDDGSAVVLHAAHDDQSSQPGGGTGDRIACGVIEASK